MQILAASLQQAADTFLHAGYISSMPRAYSRVLRIDLGDATSPGGHLVADVEQALELVASASPAAAFESAAPPVAGAVVLTSWPTLFAGVAAFFAFVGLLYLLKGRYRQTVQSRLTAGLVIVLAAGAFALHAAQALPSSEAWKRVTPRAYADPEAATRVILHGLIMDGLINTNARVKSLAQIAPEVAFPPAPHSEGMTYARQTYGIDGWGRPFKLRTGSPYTVISAGADGEFDTDDDIRALCSRARGENWDLLRHALFLHKDADGLALYLHRWPGRHFIYHDRMEAPRGADPLHDRYRFSAGEEMHQIASRLYAVHVSDPSSTPLLLLVTRGDRVSRS